MPVLFTWPRCLGLGLLVALDAIRPGLAMEDPTRPPLPVRRGSLAQPAALPSPAAQAAASAVAPAEPRLQSLHLPQQGPATALVDGQLLRVGDSHGPNTITAIDADGVSARGPAGRQRWTLLGVNYLDPAQARRAAVRRLPAEAGADDAPPLAARGQGGSTGGPPGRVPAALEAYVEAVPAPPPPAAARWNGELPPVAPGLRRPAEQPAPAALPAPAVPPARPAAALQTSAGGLAAPARRATAADASPAAAVASTAVAVASQLAAWQPDPPAPGRASTHGLSLFGTGSPAAAPRGREEAAPTWADLIATPQRLAQLLHRRLAADADLARWQQLRGLPQLAGTRLPHAQGHWVRTAMQPLPVGPAVMRQAVAERPWQAATPAGRAAVAAGQQALMALTLAQLNPPVASPANLAWPQPAAWPHPTQTPTPTPTSFPMPMPAPAPAPQRPQPTPWPVPLDPASLPPTAAGPAPRPRDPALRAALAPARPPLPSPPRPAPPPALQLRMTMELEPGPGPSPAQDPDRPAPAPQPAWAKESS